MRASRRRMGSVALWILGFLVLCLHLAGFLSAPFLDSLQVEFRVTSLLATTVSLASVCALFMSKAMSQAADALHERGDLELLLSSPLPAHRILVARLLSMAVICAIMPILIMYPLVDGMMLRGYHSWGGAYPVIAGFGCAAAALGAIATFGLLKWLGPRGAGIAGRWLAMGFGVASLLISQVTIVFPELMDLRVWKTLQRQAEKGGHGPVWWPARALFGEPWPMLSVGLLGMLLIWLAGRVLGRAYAQGVLGHAPVSRPIGNALHAPGWWPEHALWRLLLRKETTLLMRYPGMRGNLIYQTAFLLPGLMMAREVGNVAGSDIRAPAVMLMVMTIGRIARLCCAACFGADEAATLSQSSPQDARLLKGMKIAAVCMVLTPVLVISMSTLWFEAPQAIPAAAIACISASTAKIWLACRAGSAARRVGMGGRTEIDPALLSGFVSDLVWGGIGIALVWLL